MTDRAARLQGWFEASQERTRPSTPFVVAAETITYGQLYERIHKLARLFREAGLVAGERVVLGVSSDAHASVLYLSLLRLGLTAVVIDPRSPAAEVRALFEAADARGLILDASLLEAIGAGESLPGAPWTLAVGASAAAPGGALRRLLGRKKAQASPAAAQSYPELLDALEPMQELPELADDDGDALLLFTSGTTSRPKGVCISRRALAAQIETFLGHYGYDADTRILNHLPFHHTDGLCQGPTVTLAAGASLFRPGPFRVQTLPELLDSIHRDRITHLITVPTVLALILRMDGEQDDTFQAPDFRFIRSSAGALDAGLWRDFEERFGTRVVNAYGLTECVCESLYAGPGDDTWRRGSLGKPVGCQARVVDEEGRDVAQGESGELWLAGEQVMAGYFRDPEASAEVLHEGWLKTGDLVRVDADGFYHFTGRKKTLIVTGGANVHPEQVTEVALACAGVLDAVTFGEPDPIWGERVVTCYVCEAGSQLEPEELGEHCREHLSPEKIPAEVLRLPDFPRGPAGKVLLGEVRELARQLREAPAAAGVEGDVTERVLALAAGCFHLPVEQLSPRSRPDDTRGWDSLAHMQLVTQLEKAFEVRFEARDILSIQSLGDVERILAEKRRRP